MLRTLGSLVLIAALLPTATARGDGLFYQLPDDGASAQFEMKITSGNGSSRTVGVGMRSVGKVMDTPGSRWLEFKLPMEDSTQIVKVLIPEKHLKEGESPVDHVIRGWLKRGDDAPIGLSQPSHFWLQMFLAGPLTDAKKLEPQAIDTPLGKLDCPGLTGRGHIRENDGYEEDLTYTIRRHDKAPFGVVSCTIDCVVSKDGKRQGTSKFELKLTEVAKDATSELRGFE